MSETTCNVSLINNNLFVYHACFIENICRHLYRIFSSLSIIDHTKHAKSLLMKKTKEFLLFYICDSVFDMSLHVVNFKLESLRKCRIVYKTLLSTHD